MRGSISDSWPRSWPVIWRKLATAREVPTDLFIQLYDCANDFLLNPLQGTEIDLIHNDPLQARQAFHALRTNHFKGESALVVFIEAVYSVLLNSTHPHLASLYSKAVREFISRFNLRYRVTNPFGLRQLLSGTFAQLYSELDKLNNANPHFSELMDDFECTFDRYVRTREQLDLKHCIGKASMYAEALAGAACGSTGTLGELCDRLECWPHTTVKKSIKDLYGFCSNYPGIRHAGNPASQERPLEGRDALLLSVVMLCASGYVTDSISSDDVFGLV
jgi:hypothetical protein